MIENKLDIRTLLKQQLYYNAAFKFLLSKNEQGYLGVVSKKQRLLNSSDEAIEAEDVYEKNKTMSTNEDLMQIETTDQDHSYSSHLNRLKNGQLKNYRDDHSKIH